MPRIHFFNPENDLALALGQRRFTPPKAAVAIRRAGCLLPLWWAAPDDFVLVDSPEAASGALAMKKRYGLKAGVVTRAPSGAEPSPWGWSHYARRVFEAAGTDNSLLPDIATLDRLRELSHRRTTIAIHRHLGTDRRLMPVEAFSLKEVTDALDRTADAVVKLPWSSSGRGVIYSSSLPRDTFLDTVKGMINRQGSVLIEPRYERIHDFAMLFDCHDRRVGFVGLSMFVTNGKGFYGGNLVADGNEIIRRLGIDVDLLIPAVGEALTQVVAPHYNGPAGVDMLTYRDSHGITAIAPCIEVNLRMTMGFAALAIMKRLAPDRPMLLGVRADGIHLCPETLSSSIS